ncbi:hypothetical protein CSPX01_08719 [Colletotrichum filicis]|nr:hypothetical protein CSPX01_08719 [Colletotrichum filicis]
MVFSNDDLESRASDTKPRRMVNSVASPASQRTPWSQVRLVFSEARYYHPQPGEASRHRLGNEKASPALRLVAAGDNAHSPDMSRLHGLENSNVDPVIGQPHKLLGGLHGHPCATTSTNFQPCVQTALTVVSTGKEEETLSRPRSIVVPSSKVHYQHVYKEEELGSWKGFALLHFIASQGEADPLLEKQNVGSVF